MEWNDTDYWNMALTLKNSSRILYSATDVNFMKPLKGFPFSLEKIFPFSTGVLIFNVAHQYICERMSIYWKELILVCDVTNRRKAPRIRNEHNFFYLCNDLFIIMLVMKKICFVGKGWRKFGQCWFSGTVKIRKSFHMDMNLLWEWECIFWGVQWQISKFE